MITTKKIITETVIEELTFKDTDIVIKRTTTDGKTKIKIKPYKVSFYDKSIIKEMASKPFRGFGHDVCPKIIIPSNEDMFEMLKGLDYIGDSDLLPLEHKEWDHLNYLTGKIIPSCIYFDYTTIANDKYDLPKLLQYLKGSKYKVTFYDENNQKIDGRVLPIPYIISEEGREYYLHFSIDPTEQWDDLLDLKFVGVYTKRKYIMEYFGIESFRIK